MKKKEFLIVFFLIIIVAGIFVLLMFKGKKHETIKYDIDGTYTFNRLEKNGNPVGPAELFGTGSVYGGTLTINKDKTYSEYIGITGEDDKYVGTYKVEGNKIVLVNKENVEQVCSIDKDTITVEDKVYGNGYTIVFKKEKDKNTIIKETITDYFKGNYGNDINTIKFTNIEIISEEDNKISFNVTYDLTLNKGVDPKKYTSSNGEVDGLTVKNKKSIGDIKKDVNGNYIITSLRKG